MQQPDTEGLLRFTSIQSGSADFICRRITQHVAKRLGMHAEFVGHVPWPERERLLDQGQVHAGWICGLPYVRKVDRDHTTVQLLAAPVMRHPRYQSRPIHFSDVVVHTQSRYHTFDDLRGACWAYNEPHSHSGYNLTRYHLATLGEESGYFGRVVRAGSHLRALQMVLDRQIDASAIDSTVLELELQRRPDLKGQIRIIEVLGPSPVPPWVVAGSVTPDLREAIREAFLQVHEDPEGQPILRAGQMERFVRVEDRDYDTIRQMARKAEQVIW